MSVINAGVPSYNLRQSYDRLVLDVLNQVEYPTIVATFQAANDVFLLTQYRDSWTPEVTWADIRFEQGWNRPTAFATVHYLKKVKQALQGRDSQNGKDDWWPPSNMLANVQRTLSEIGQTCSSRSIVAVMLPIDPFYYQTAAVDLNPSLSNWRRWKPYVELWDTTIRDFNSLLREAADSSSCIHFLDTRMILDQANRENLYVDFIHLSPQGNKIVAEALLSYLQEHQLVGEPDNQTEDH